MGTYNWKKERGQNKRNSKKKGSKNNKEKKKDDFSHQNPSELSRTHLPQKKRGFGSTSCVTARCDLYKHKLRLRQH